MDKDPLANELDAWDANGMTPLLNAVFVGDTEKVQRLLEMGADPNRPSNIGGTPLWHAEDDFGLIEIAKLLRRRACRADGSHGTFSPPRRSLDEPSDDARDRCAH